MVVQLILLVMVDILVQLMIVVIGIILPVMNVMIVIEEVILPAVMEMGKFTNYIYFFREKFVKNVYL